MELKDDVCEKQSAVTINPRHMKKAFRIMNELRRYVSLIRISPGFRTDESVRRLNDELV